MKILCLSDHISELVYSERIQERFGDVDFAISCGDLPFHYYEFVSSSLNIPLYYVHGNHRPESESNARKIFDPEGKRNLEGKIIRERNGLRIAGLSCGSEIPNFKLGLSMAWNRIFQGQGADILVCHFPPQNCNDGDDTLHQGLSYLPFFLRRTRPKFLLHGHIHLYDRRIPRENLCCQTRVINCYDYFILEWKMK